MGKARVKECAAWERPGLLMRLVVQGALWGLAVLVALPLVWMVSTALKTRGEALAGGLSIVPEAWAWGNFAEAWRSAELGRYYANSAWAAAVTTALATAHNALAGYAFAKLRFAGRSVLFGLAVGTMLLPFQAYFIFTYWICGHLGYIDNLQALVVPFLASGFGIFHMRQAIAGVPDELIEAGRVDGMSELEVLVHIAAPAVRPALAALAVFTFMASWNSFFWPLIVIDSTSRQTLPLAVKALASNYYTESWPVQMAAATLITLPAIGVFILFQGAFTRGLTLGGVKE